MSVHLSHIWFLLNLSSSLATIFKLINKVMACKMKAKFNFELYSLHSFRSYVPWFAGNTCLVGSRVIHAISPYARIHSSVFYQQGIFFVYIELWEYVHQFKYSQIHYRIFRFCIYFFSGVKIFAILGSTMGQFIWVLFALDNTSRYDIYHYWV